MRILITHIDKMIVCTPSAGGKMDARLAANLTSDHDVAYVKVRGEVGSEAGRNRLKGLVGVDCVSLEEALADAGAVVLAVTDTAIGKVASGIVPNVDPSTIVIALDAAAPYAGHLPKRSDITYFVTHPCHPPIFNDEVELKAKRVGSPRSRRSSTR